MAKKIKQTFNSKKEYQMSTTDQPNGTDENLDTTTNTDSSLESSSEDTGEQVNVTTDSPEGSKDEVNSETGDSQPDNTTNQQENTDGWEDDMSTKEDVSAETIDNSKEAENTKVTTEQKTEVEDEVPFITQTNEQINTSDVVLTSIKHQLDSYAEAMAPGKPISHTEGALRQKSLWNSIKAVIETESVDFNDGWGMLVEEFKSKHLSPRYVNRFNEHLTLSLPELHAFERMVNLLILTADEKTKDEVLKHVDLDRTLAEGISEFGRNRIINYYHK